MMKRLDLLSLLSIIAALLQQGACSKDGVYKRKVPATSIKQSPIGNDVETAEQQSAPESVNGDKPDYAPQLNHIDDTQYATRVKQDIHPVGYQSHEKINSFGGAEIATRARRRLDYEMPKEHFEASGSRDEPGEMASLETSEEPGINHAPNKAPMHSVYPELPDTGESSTAARRRHYSIYREQQSEQSREHVGLPASVKYALSNAELPLRIQCQLPSYIFNIVALNCGTAILLTVAIVILLLKRSCCGNRVGVGVGAGPLIIKNQLQRVYAYDRLESDGEHDDPLVKSGAHSLPVASPGMVDVATQCE